MINNEATFKSNSHRFKNNIQITRESIIKEQETIQLTLRKERMDYLIASKRKRPQNEEPQDASYRIKIKDLQLPSEYEINLNKYYENFNLAFLKNYFYSNNIILQKYAVYILLTYISIDGDSNNTHINEIASQLDSEFLSVLCRYLIIQDKSFQYESCWVIINLVFNDNADQLLCNNEDNLKNVLLFYTNAINDSILYELGLWLIRNLTYNNIKAQYYFLKEKILELFPISIEKFPFQEKNKEIMIIIVNNLILTKSNLNEYSSQFLEVIPLLTQQLFHKTPLKLLRRVLFCMFHISSIQESIDPLINHTIHLKIMDTLTELRKRSNLNDEDNQNMNHIIIYSLKIIGNLLSNNDVQTQRLLNDNIIDFLNYYLEDSSYLILYNTLWAISNIACGTVCQIIQLYKKNILLKVIHIGIKIYEEFKVYDKDIKRTVLDVFKEVLYIICFCIQGSLHESLLCWLGYSNCVVIVFLSVGLKIYMKDYALIKNIINALIKVIQIEKNNDIDMNEEVYINTLISHNIEDNIKRLQSCCNSEICNLADTLYEDIFN